MEKHPTKPYFAYRSFWKEFEARKQFEALGANSTCFFIANTKNSFGVPYCQYDPVWLPDGRTAEGVYDFGPADEQIQDIIRVTPSQKLICMMDLNAPHWLRLRFNLDSMTELGCLCSDSEWRRVTALFMKALLTHVETRYGDRVVAYVLACGRTDEWYDHSDLRDSKSRAAAWRRHLEAQQQPFVPIPDYEARERVAFDNLLRDPQQDGDTLRYIRFCADEIQDTIAFFLKEARTVIRPEMELGVFSGYPLVLAGKRVIVGNNDCRRLLTNPDLDFIISPTGGFSDIGMGGGDLGPLESVYLHGKRYLRECDQRTHSFNRELAKHFHLFWKPMWKTPEASVAGIKRELSCCLIKQTDVWWFDMWGGFYTDPVVQETLRQSCDLYRQYVADDVSGVAETVLIVDPDSIYYLNQNDFDRTFWFYNQTKRMLDLIGAPWACYHLEDIPKIPHPERIKFWLLPAIFEVTPEKRALLDAHVRRPGCTAFYLYAPGISDGKTLDPERVLELTGTAFGTPGVNRADRNGGCSVYLASGQDMTTGLLRQLAGEAGVHLYLSEDASVYANSRFLSVHVAEAGTRRIRLPRACDEVRELYSGTVVARACDAFDYTFEAPDTVLYECLWKGFA